VEDKPDKLKKKTAEMSAGYNVSLVETEINVGIKSKYTRRRYDVHRIYCTCARLKFLTVTVRRAKDLGHCSVREFFIDNLRRRVRNATFIEITQYPKCVLRR